VRDDPCSRREREQARPQLQVHLGQQVHRHHRRGGEVGPEQVLLAELDAALDAGSGGALAARSHELGDELDAEAAGAEAPRRGDDDAAVSRAEVDDVIASADGGELEHRQRHRVGCGDEGNLVLRDSDSDAGAEADRERRRPAGPSCTVAKHLPGSRAIEPSIHHAHLEGHRMAKGYWIARVDVADAEAYKAYVAANAAPLARFGARFIVRAGRFENPEGTSRSRNVVVEFPSYQAALDCWKSADYQAAVQLRLPVSTVDMVIVEGYDGPQPGA
jgi:uncharacterized protein (DUF1330 family)